MEQVPELLQHLFRNNKPFNQSCKIVNLLLQSINLAQKTLPTLNHLGAILPVYFLMEFLKLP